MKTRFIFLLSSLFFLLCKEGKGQVYMDFDSEYLSFVEVHDHSGFPDPPDVSVFSEIISHIGADSTLPCEDLYYTSFLDPIQFDTSQAYTEELFLYVDTLDNLLKGISGYNYYNSIYNSFVLYDYNQSIGDTINSDYFNLSNDAPFVIINVDTIEYNGTNRRTLHTNNGLTIIQGIGTTSGFFPRLNTFEHYLNLMCVKLDNTLSYGDPCYASIDETQLNISVYPNPANDYLFIESDHNISQYSIINLRGQLLETGQLIANNIDVSHLDQGAYFVRLEDALGQTQTIKFIKSN